MLIGISEWRGSGKGVLLDEDTDVHVFFCGLKEDQNFPQWKHGVALMMHKKICRLWDEGGRIMSTCGYALLIYVSPFPMWKVELSGCQ